MSEGDQTGLPNPPGIVEKRTRDPNFEVPGERNGLPQGTLRELPPEPQGDENRDPPKAPMPPP